MGTRNRVIVEADVTKAMTNARSEAQDHYASGGVMSQEINVGRYCGQTDCQRPQ
jgi:hypothetical protein